MRLLTVQLPLRPNLPPAQWASAGLWSDLAFSLHEGQGNIWTKIQSANINVVDLPSADCLRLIVPACDVRLLTVKLPPMPANKLKLALPLAVEDQLLQDPQQCHLAVSAINAQGERSVAVIDKAWMRAVVERFQKNEADDTAPRNAYTQIQILPAQLELPWPPTGEDSQGNIAQATASEMTLDENAFHPACVLRTIRTGPISGYGLRLAKQGSQPEMAWPSPTQIISAEILAAQAPNLDAPINLCQFEFADAAQTHTWANWRTWRWPLALAILIILVQGLSTLSQSWALSREATQIRSAMADTLHSVLPKEPVVDAPLQLRRYVEQLRSAGGKLSPEDFSALSERLAKVMQGQAPDVLQGMQYQQRNLVITLKAGANVTAISEKAAQMGLRLQSENTPAGQPSRWRVIAKP